jgi:hypothetical protein
MPNSLLRRALPTPLLTLLAFACALPPAHADIYTWTDDKGRVNISNLEPPDGARVTNVMRENKAMTAANEAAREAAREREREALKEAEVRALAERVRQLQAEVENARRPAPPPVVAAAPAPAYVPYSGEYAPPPVAQYNFINASPTMGGGGGGGYGCYTGWPDCQFGWYPGFYPGFYPVSVVLPRDRHFRRDHFPARPTPHPRGPVAPWSPIPVRGAGRGP